MVIKELVKRSLNFLVNWKAITVVFCSALFFRYLDSFIFKYFFSNQYLSNLAASSVTGFAIPSAVIDFLYALIKPLFYIALLAIAFDFWNKKSSRLDAILTKIKSCYLALLPFYAIYFFANIIDTFFTLSLSSLYSSSPIIVYAIIRNILNYALGFAIMLVPPIIIANNYPFLTALKENFKILKLHGKQWFSVFLIIAVISIVSMSPLYIDIGLSLLNHAKNPSTLPHPEPLLNMAQFIMDAISSLLTAAILTGYYLKIREANKTL